MNYFYAAVPGVGPPIPDPSQGPVTITSLRLLMEHALMDLRVPAERLDLLDGTRVFRTAAQYAERLQKDTLGYFVRFGETKVYWSPVCPVQFSREWRPL